MVGFDVKLALHGREHNGTVMNHLLIVEKLSSAIDNLKKSKPLYADLVLNELILINRNRHSDSYISMEFNTSLIQRIRVFPLQYHHRKWEARCYK